MRASGQGGNITVWLLIMLLSCSAAGYLFGLLVCYMPAQGITVPTVLVGILAAPCVAIAQLIFKLNDVKKIKGLSKSEKRRLNAIADLKVVRAYVLLAVMLVWSSVTAVLFYLTTTTVPGDVLLWALRMAGAMVPAAILATLYTVQEGRNISNFEAKIMDRSQIRKNNAALLKRLEGPKP